MVKKKDKKDIEEQVEEKEPVTAEETENTADAKEENAEESKEEKAEPEVVEVNVDFKDRYIRLSADFDNYRKRTLKEKMDLMNTAGESIMKEILPVFDDFERAMNAMKFDESNPDSKANKEGIDIIYNKFKDFLKAKGVSQIDVKNKEFDTDIHEAITKIPAPTPELKGKIVDVIENGYELNGKVIRYAKVVIGE